MATGKRVVYYVSKNIFKSRKRHLVIEPEAEAALDSIIIAYTIIDKRKKDAQNAAAAASASNTASAAAAS